MSGKVKTGAEALAHIQNGAVIMVGGFNVSGVPHSLCRILLQETQATDLTIVNIDGAGVVGSELSELLHANRIKKVIGTFFGANKETQKRITEGTLAYELVPQGTFVERIRCGGAGLGGILTPTGVGTVLEESRQTLVVDGRKYLLELPLRADVALIRAEIADESGNLYMIGTARNTNTVMATAADYVVAQAEKIVPTGALDPNLITVPSIYVDAIVKAGENA